MTPDIQRVQSALAFIPAQDRDTWLRMGMAVKSELGDDGFPIWNEWSQNAENYAERDAKAVWRSITPTGKVTGGTLIHEAKQRGWKPSGSAQRPDAAEIERQRRERADRAAKDAAELAARNAKARDQAQEIWKRCQPLMAHDYATAKGIKAYGARLYKGPLIVRDTRVDGSLVTPLVDGAGVIHALQYITPAGDKLFPYGSAKSGHYFAIGKPAQRIIVCEGYATACSIHEATGEAVAVAFDRTNLAPVAAAIRAKYPDMELLIAADNDAWTEGNPGTKNATEAAQAVNARVAVPVFKDASGKPTDFNDLHKLEGLEAVKAQIEGAAKPEPAPASAPLAPDTRGGDVVVRLLNGADIEPEVIRWLWDGWLSRGKLHVMAGAPGTGKTTIALALAATVSTGGRFPDGSKCEAGNVLVWSGEDDPKDTLLPRLLAMGADRKRIYFVTDAYIAGERVTFDPAHHFSALAEAATSIGGIRLMVVDPIVSAVAGDSHKAAEVRRSLQPVVDLAAKLDAAMVGISHFSKGTQGSDPLERVTGSNAFGALPRVVMATAKVKDNDAPDATPKRILVRTKSNIGPDGGGYEYSLNQQAVDGYPGLFASCVLWGGELEGTAKQLLATAETDADPDEQSEHKSAEDWLRELLDETNGMQAGEIIKTAKANGYGERTIYRVKNRLRLVVKTTGFGKERASTWSLPITAKAPITDSITAITDNPEIGSNGSYGGSNDENAVVV
jgi:putative DNA primase/helicase